MSSSAKEQRTIGISQVIWIATIWDKFTCIEAIYICTDVFDHDSASSGAVTLPQFCPISAIIGSKVQRPVDVGEMRVRIIGVRVIERMINSRINVFDHDSASRSAIALPQFCPISAITSKKVQCPIEVGELVCGISCTIEIFDYDSASSGAVTLPQLVSTYAVISSKVQRPVDISEMILLAKVII